MAHADHYVLHARGVRSDAPARTAHDDAARAELRHELDLAVTGNLQELEHEWRAFERRADCTAFQSFDWLATWHDCIGARSNVVPAIVTGRQKTGELLFILPLAVQRSPLARRLIFLGRDLCDYNAPLLAPAFPRCPEAANFVVLWQEIGRLLQRDAAYRHDVIMLDKMPERIGGQPNPFLQLAVSPNPSGAYLTSLTPDWEAFYAGKRSAATRRRDRTKRKRLAESGDVRMVTPDDAAGTAATVDALIAQKRRAFARMGVADIFARPGYCQLFSALALQAPDLVHVSRLEVGSTPAATNLGLVFRDCYYHVLASYDDGPLSRFGPGAAHLHELMRYAISRGCTRFDFTIGDESYKRDWCDTEVTLYDHIAAATTRGWIAAAPAAAWRRLKRFMKQSPVVWPMVTRVRAALAAVRGRGAPKRTAPAQAE